ncbi:uncharacterized protein LOC122864514 isoform X8 [Siniperca chuatsi]|uniref:uncharacterized protein LOC122864514 isoform X8 n=1 Tax=Siniperca chuatsi TaxID=119488 RepID=UPI001CE14949|nr:uncharacterized protein LOC122864514 isoform X8 [Siniperca chuatsi]
MEHNSLGCQVCLTTFNKMCDLKQHMRSRAHQEKMEEVFQKDKFKGSGFFPFIIVMDPLSKHEMKQPIIGLSLLTMCFSRETKTFFYLCHVCEEKRPPDKILHHLSSGDHCSNYFNYTNPNVLSFSWVPSMDMRVVLRPEITKEVKERGPGQLQMLDLPENLLKKLETSTYFEVMRALSENDKLLKLLEAVKPKRTMIQTYQRDSNRKHPLLGMQHLVECICVGPTEKRYYLCTLCNLTLATHAIIKHVLSFDHIFSYFKAWHPSTLVSKECYKDYTKQFASEILDFAKQTEEIHGTANTDMKQMSLEPGEFQSVNFACYAKALKELESITKEKRESSLITSVKQGKKLEFRIQSARPVASCYKLRCQDCSMNFKTISPYLQHLTKWNHKQMLKKFFGEAERVDGYDQTGTKPNLGLYRYLLESTKQNQPAIGVPLVVTCVNTEVQGEAIYVCFACEDCFPESLLRQHFNSRKHLIHTLLYQNPWRLPFAWENPLDVEVLRSMAWDEEKERGPNQMLLKVLDMPYWMFQRLIPPSYPKVMERLELYHTLLKREVPRRETYSKLKQSERFPLLGQQFLVMHVVCVRRHQSTEVGSLCLLCERRLSDDECYAHVFSREHVGKFLDRFHPGSQNSSTDAETLLDLAKQAARVHSISHVQVVKLDKPIWEPCSYHRAISILTSAKKRDRKGKLEPEIMPKQKLFPRETLKEVDKDHMRDNSQKNGRMMEGSVKNPSQKSTENTVKVGAEMTNTKCGENAEKGADEETPTPSEKESEKRREVFSKTSSEEIKNAGSDTCQAIKEEKIEEPTEIGEERRKDVPTRLKNNMYKENKRKRPSSMSEKSQEDTCPNEDVEKDMGQKRQRLTSKHDASSCEEPQNLPSSGQKEATTSDKDESHKTAKDKASSNMNYQQAAQLWQYVKRKSREPVVGLSALLECHCDQCDPIYLCECCSLKIPEKDIVSHVTGFDHQKMYLVGLQKLPTPPWNHQRMIIRQRALLLEKDEGYGDAQVVDVDEEIYNNISKQNFKSAIQTVKALQAQQESRLELPSTSALSAVQPVDTSVTLHAQYEVYSLTDDFQVSQFGINQVVETDDHSEDSEAQPSSVTATESVMTETSCKTTQVLPESADNTNTCLTVSRSSEDTSSLHVSTCGKNTTRLQPDSTEKAEIISNTTVGPLKIAATSKIVGTSQTAATSDSTVTTPTKSTTAVSKCTVESSISTPDTTKSTAPISKLTVPSSSCNTATTKLRETAYKCVASATASTTKLTAANPNSSTTTTISTAPTYSCTTTTTNCRETAFKCVSSTSSVTETTSKFTATVSKLTGTTSTSSVNISGATSTTKSATVSKPLESRTGAAKMTKTSVKCENTEASPKTVHMKNSVGSNADVAPNIPKSKAPEAPHLMSVRSENRSPSTEPSHTSTSKTKPHESSPRVGLNMLIVVRCEGRQQIYCQLCSVKLLSSTHLRSYTHKYNYVKKMIPECTAKPSEFAKLDKMVALLAEVEKVAGSRSPETIEVKNDVYEELAALPEDKAVERLKEMVRQRDLRHSSSSTTNAAEVLRQQVAFASPCEVSSPDDGMYMPQNEMAGLSTDNQSEQENKHELQKLLVQMPEIESISEEDGNLAPGQSDKAQSFYGKSPQANDLISDQLHLCPTLINDPKPITTPIIQDADVGVKVEQETFEYDVESQATVDVTPAIESQVKMEKPQGWADPLATDSESTGRFAQTLDTCQETPEKGQQQERSDPELQDTQKVLEGTQKTSPVKIFNPDPLFSATSVNTEIQQNQSRPSQKTEHVPKHSGCSPGPWHHSASQTLPIFSIGEKTQGPSHLSSWLKVKGLETEPVIGLGSVWECRGIGLGSKFLNSFFLCESCSETLSTNDICQHMVSSDHQRKYMKRHYPEFLYWSKDDLDEDMKLEVLNGIAWMLSLREREIDAQCILLKRELYEYVRKAPFSEALNIVQEFEKEPKQRVFCLPISTPRQKDQQPEDRQSLEESLPTEIQSAQALETDQRSDNGSTSSTCSLLSLQITVICEHHSPRRLLPDLVRQPVHHNCN